jgi:molybdopterin molybdotransferase
MKEFFEVQPLSDVLRLKSLFPILSAESVSLENAVGRVLAEEISAAADLPDFCRATMDGYGVRAASTFGASDANPAYLNVVGSVAMGEVPAFSIGPGQACRIATGGMLPEGADSVVMIEHTDSLDAATIEVHRSVAPGQHVLQVGEDYTRGQALLNAGQPIRPQESGLLAAFGHRRVKVFRRPVIGILSTGDEIVAIDAQPGLGQIRDMNSYTLSGQLQQLGAVPVRYGIVADDPDTLFAACRSALEQSDMVLLSGGSSVGMRDYTVEVLSKLENAHILVHGIAISPGKPTILARTGSQAVWGLPGNVVSAMVVFRIVVAPFVAAIQGQAAAYPNRVNIPAVLSRNIASAQGRSDFVRVRLQREDDGYLAQPILGKSGLIHTMVSADGLVEVDADTEGLDAGTAVGVIPF